MEEIKCGVTSPTVAEASSERLLELVRAHWSIENGLHFRRDETFREDRCRLTGQGAQAMAVLKNLVLGLLHRKAVDSVPDARRYYAAITAIMDLFLCGTIKMLILLLRTIEVPPGQRNAPAGKGA